MNKKTLKTIIIIAAIIDLIIFGTLIYSNNKLNFENYEPSDNETKITEKKAKEIAQKGFDKCQRICYYLVTK